MSSSVSRHVRSYLNAGFWLTVLAAALNALYWRLPVSLTAQLALAWVTAAVALLAAARNARALREGAVAGGRLGRRVTYLLITTSLLVVATVILFQLQGAG